MTYGEAIPNLNNNHIYPKTVTKVKKKESVIVGLEVYASPLLKEEKGIHLRKVLGGGWNIDWLPNEENFFITIKSKQ